MRLAWAFCFYIFVETQPVMQCACLSTIGFIYLYEKSAKYSLILGKKKMEIFAILLYNLGDYFAVWFRSR